MTRKDKANFCKKIINRNDSFGLLLKILKRSSIETVNESIVFKYNGQMIILFTPTGKQLLIMEKLYDKLWSVYIEGLNSNVGSETNIIYYHPDGENNDTGEYKVFREQVIIALVKRFLPDTIPNEVNTINLVIVENIETKANGKERLL